LESEKKDDRLAVMFSRQREFMDMLKDADKMPEYPVDMTSKPGQRLIKETTFNLIEELFEACYTLKNRMHRLTDARVFDFEHYREELGDAFAYFMEVCLLSGISDQDICDEFLKKNAIVKERLRRGY
jgi:NTP pyrophosphatase (non-canonical NTP hydrolase)